MTTDTAIPALSCVTLDESLPFYGLLGFEVTGASIRRRRTAPA